LDRASITPTMIDVLLGPSVPVPSSSSSTNNDRKRLAFLSHNWGSNEFGIDNHAFVRCVRDALEDRNVFVWFDEDNLADNIQDGMCRGIESCPVTVVFVTKKYMIKTWEGDQTENCRRELQYAINRRLNANMIIPVVVDVSMLNQLDWQGMLGSNLGSHMYVRLTFQPGSAEFGQGMDKLADMIKQKAGV
jgi:hypothetical protein